MSAILSLEELIEAAKRLPAADRARLVRARPDESAGRAQVPHYRTAWLR